jgi:hypothetical protein
VFWPGRCSGIGVCHTAGWLACAGPQSRPLGVLGGELGRLLPLPRGLDGLMEGLRPDGELARRIFGLGARLADWIGSTGRGMETDAHHGST